MLNKVKDALDIAIIKKEVMKEVIDIVSGAGSFVIVLMSGLFGFLLVVLLILICLNEKKRESVVRQFVLIINALRGKSKTEP
ncbi:hypothetical protein [Dokdonia sp. Asnod1-B02]|uniref:hypothetical protein n=1 Tax=Dokdonia sp. Asnod1-B02 TaxID=3160573 RepID=UPI00386914CE